MGPPDRLRGAGLFLMLLLLTTGVLAQSGQISQVTDSGVRNRMAAMNANNAALTVLGDMMGGRAVFDRARARDARRRLIATTGRIPALFRKAHADPLSNARPDIWSNWGDFKGLAKSAQRAARGLDSNSLPRLRKTLPRLVHSCLACHRAYRKDMR
ncbi:c-type cytochrome [Sedimentitalea todarodis]|uniref:Cytochrome c n=1 Tax=Sedimentitalea todarodis TaxID=1631240 RepID=A0ABU3VAH9_9RHOB|nr:cytochrome c [Sedimentitalea todarodis]MDU9003176.1 cytochrome c [Sedimentitalea todarodis]